MKKITSLIIVVLVSFYANEIGATDTNSSASINRIFKDEYSSFTGANDNSRIYYGNSISDTSKIDLNSIAGNFKESIIINEKIYAVNTSNGIHRLSVINYDGVIEKEVKLADSVGFFSRISYGDNKIFVPLENKIQAFDINTLKSIWISEDLKGQLLSSTMYYDGYLYTGVVTKASASDLPSAGYFVAINTADDNPTQELETKKKAWVYEKGNDSGYYWAGVTIVNNAVVFIGDNGILISHHLKKALIYDQLNLNTIIPNVKTAKTRSSVVYDAKSKYLYLATQNSMHLVKVKIENNYFNKSSFKYQDSKIKNSGGIAVVNNRIYIPSGGMRGTGFSVFDTNFNEIFSTTKYNSQSVPLVKRSNNKNYVYFLDYSTSKLVILEDDLENNQQKFSEYTNQAFQSYNSNTILGNENGDLIFPNYGGEMFILKNNISSYSKTEIEEMIDSLSNPIKYEDRDSLFKVARQYQLANINVNNFSKLEAYFNTYDDLSDSRIKDITTKIMSIEKLSDEEVILLVNEYYSLYPNERKLVINNNKLLERANSIDNKINISDLVQKIKSLPSSVNLNHEINIKLIYQEYLNAIKVAKINENDGNKIEKLYQQVITLRKKVDDLDKKIDNLPLKITKSHFNQIISLTRSYDSLDTISKKYIQNYDYLSDCSNKVIRLQNFIKINNTTYYYQIKNKGWFNFKSITTTGTTKVTVLNYFDAKNLKQKAPKANNGARVQKIIKENIKNKKVVKKEEKQYNFNKKLVASLVYIRKSKLINTNKITYTYDRGGNTIQSLIIKRNSKNQVIEKNKRRFKGKKLNNQVIFKYKNNKVAARFEYQFNKQKKKTVYYRTWYKKNKAIKTEERKYNKNNKLMKAKKVKLRTKF